MKPGEDGGMDPVMSFLRRRRRRKQLAKNTAATPRMPMGMPTPSPTFWLLVRPDVLPATGGASGVEDGSSVVEDGDEEEDEDEAEDDRIWVEEDLCDEDDVCDVTDERVEELLADVETVVPLDAVHAVLCHTLVATPDTSSDGDCDGDGVELVSPGQPVAVAERLSLPISLALALALALVTGGGVGLAVGGPNFEIRYA
jgi:hypothetical protein